MAEPDVKPPEGAGGGIKKALSRKVGPLPLGAWIGIAAVILYFVMQRNAGADAGGETDAAGNVGTINPATGYVYGSAEDTAARGSGSTSLGTSSDSGSGTSTVSGTYQDNQAWSVVAINYLVSLGTDATAANTAITSFLSSQTLTAEQHAMVNLAIQRLGAPPNPPEPGTTNPPPVVTPPAGTTYAANPPTGFTADEVTAHQIHVKWNKVANAKSYTFSWGTSLAAVGNHTRTVYHTSSAAIGLKPNTLYHLRVYANPAKPGAGIYAGLVKTTKKK